MPCSSSAAHASRNYVANSLHTEDRVRSLSQRGRSFAGSARGQFRSLRGWYWSPCCSCWCSAAARSCSAASRWWASSCRGPPWQISCETSPRTGDSPTWVRRGRAAAVRPGGDGTDRPARRRRAGPDLDRDRRDARRHPRGPVGRAASDPSGLAGPGRGAGLRPRPVAAERDRRGSPRCARDVRDGALRDVGRGPAGRTRSEPLAAAPDPRRDRAPRRGDGCVLAARSDVPAPRCRRGRDRVAAQRR